MTNKLLLIIVAALVVAAAVVVVLAYTFFDLGLTPNTGGGLRVALSSFSAETLDPSLDNQDGLKYHGHLYDHLAGVNGEGRLDTQLGLISGWEASPTADAFTLTIRENAQWHDGNPVIAEDVRTSLEYYFREGATCGVCGNVKDAVAGVDVVDNRNVTLRLASSDVVFMGLLAPVEGDMPLLPAHVLGDNPAALNTAPIGSGPWLYGSKSLGESVHFEPNADYWNAERISPFDTLDITLAPEEPQRIALLETGSVDIAPIGTDAFEHVRAHDYRIDGPKHVVSTALRFFMSYDTDFLTSSIEFRKALAYSVNMPEIVASAYPPEAASVATGSALFTPVSPGYIEDLPTYPYDPDEARAQLAQSGYAGEAVKLISLVAYGLSEMPLINEMIVEDWREVGINAEVVPTEWPAVQPLFMPRPQLFDDFAPAPILHGAQPSRPGGDINSVRRYMSGADGAMLTYYAPDVADSMLYQIQAAVKDDERNLTLQALNRKTYAEFWAIPIFWRHDTYAVKQTLINWQPTNGTSSDLHFETITRLAQ